MAFSKPFVYFGSSRFSEIILKSLLDQNYIPTLVITTQAQPAGRGLKLLPTPVETLAQKYNLPILAVSSLKNEETKKQIIAAQTPVAILAAFGKIIPQDVLEYYTLGIINIHPSLLPKYRGASPIQNAILNNDATTGVSLIKLDKELDHGPILSQQEIKIESLESYQSLELKLAHKAVEMIIKNIPEYLTNPHNLKEQNHGQATFTKIIKKTDGEINWQNSALNIFNQGRALNSWPGTWTKFKGKTLKIITMIPKNQSHGQPGLVLIDGKDILVSTGNGSVKIDSVQLEGGKQIQANDFILGHKDFIGSILPN